MILCKNAHFSIVHPPMNIKIILFFLAISQGTTAQNAFYTRCSKHVNVKTGVLSLYGEVGPVLSIHSESRFTDHFWGDMGVGYSTKATDDEEQPLTHRGYFSYTVFYAPLYNKAWRASYGVGISTLVSLTEIQVESNNAESSFRTVAGIIPQMQQTADITYHWALRWALQLSSTLFIDREKSISYAVEGGVSYAF